LKKICLYDTSYVTDNLGDQIIMEAVTKHLRQIFPEGFFTGIPTHDYPGPISLSLLKESDHTFVGGTNMLTSHWLWYRQWKLHLKDLKSAGDPILMGVGWHKYQRRPDIVTRLIYRTLLSRTYKHSIRDRYTCEKLRDIGVANVIYTGCPTMWDLTAERLSGIPLRKAPNVFFTLTGYLKKPDSDREFVQRLARNYDRLFFWPQMHEDLEYLQSIAPATYTIVEPSLDSARETLSSHDIDYVGMRLHCGVLALQTGVRALIVEIDNRATEIARDTKLQTARRTDFDYMEKWIHVPSAVQLDIPTDNIASWKSQFARETASH
jgi:polysaccharide pyruvyl transferase WcaK-like protein